MEFTDTSKIKAETGLIFGFAGAEVLDEAIERAAGTEQRKVRVISAVNLAGLRGRADVAGVVRIKSRDDLNAVIQTIKKDKGGAFVFYGLVEYLQFVLNGILGEAAPLQADWGTAARFVSNDIIEIADVAEVIYVTAEVVKDEKTKENRFAMNPGLTKLILGHLHAKVFVGSRGGKRVVQTDPKLALEFRLATATAPTAESADPKKARKLD